MPARGILGIFILLRGAFGSRKSVFRANVRLEFVVAQEEKKFITKKSENLSQWYLDVVLGCELADYAPVKGCMVFRPYGWAIWESVRELLNRRIIDTGHVNAQFPLLIPESFLKKEAEHVQGFAPEVAWVTHGGGEELGERLAIRPTSEAIICHMYSKWINSYRDLPVLINQWANVMRWEKKTKPFLRTTEFHWQEGHTAHRTHDEALEEVIRMLHVYRDFAQEDLSMAVLAGPKSDTEKFAGADKTYTIEAMMPDGKALQSGTSHDLGQHFAKVFDIKFLDDDQIEKYVWQTSWGVSTRIVGGIIMMHGDDSGLKLPPMVAPVQIAVVPIIFEKSKALVLEKAAALADALSKLTVFGRPVRVKFDASEQQSAGWKFNQYEMMGVPLRVEVGPKDVENGTVKVVERVSGDKALVKVDFGDIAFDAAEFTGRLEAAQRQLFEASSASLAERTHEVSNIEELEEIIANNKGFAAAPWGGTDADELAIKERTGATVRVLLSEIKDDNIKCFYSGAPARHRAVFAASY